MENSVEFYYQMEHVLNDISLNGTSIPYVHNVRTVGQAGFEIKTGLTKEDKDFEHILILLDSHDDAEIVSFKVLIQSYDSVWEDMDFRSLDKIKALVSDIKSRKIYEFTGDDEVIFPSLEAIAVIFNNVLDICGEKTHV